MVDIQEKEGVDIVSDCSKLTCFSDQSVDEIYASNILEHWPHTQTLDVLKEWYRVLKPNAKISISVPDMDANFRLFKKHGLTLWVQNLIWGDQLHPLAYHYINFTYGTLAFLMNKAGFRQIERVKFFDHSMPDASCHLDTIDKEPVSLNVKAIK